MLLRSQNKNQNNSKRDENKYICWTEHVPMDTVIGGGDICLRNCCFYGYKLSALLSTKLPSQKDRRLFRFDSNRVEINNLEVCCFVCSVRPGGFCPRNISIKFMLSYIYLKRAFPSPFPAQTSTCFPPFPLYPNSFPCSLDAAVPFLHTRFVCVLPCASFLLTSSPSPTLSHQSFGPSTCLL